MSSLQNARPHALEVVSKPKLLWQDSISSMSSTASTASGGCRSGSHSPASSRSVETHDTCKGDTLACLPESYLPAWCVKNTFVDFVTCETSARRRSASVPARNRNADCISLEEVRQSVCPAKEAPLLSREDSLPEQLHAEHPGPRQRSVLLLATSIAPPPPPIQPPRVVAVRNLPPPPKDTAPKMEVFAGRTAELAGFPSIGSLGHYTRQCSPCAFIHTKGCTNGAACRFCHLCDKGEKKRRQKQKWGKLPTQASEPDEQ
mmetsp:Transcript_27001/g.49671  ORF Transcript_27001/g.49671 Transcript_27001/m.49671 type:complete len:260 (-) Transcript_27001:127-906(-)